MDLEQRKRNDNLKTIAMFTMLIDHLGHMHLIPDIWYTLSRTVGRIAFPIFAYQIAVGFEKTSNRRRYALRLFVFACISQIPYIWFNPELKRELFHFNIMFLLLAGLGVLQLYELARKAWSKYRNNQQVRDLLISVSFCVLTLLSVALPEIITIRCLQRGIDVSFEYSSYGLLMILFFHWFRQKPWKMFASYVLLSLLGVLLTTFWVLVKYGPQITGTEIGYFQALADWDLIRAVITRNNVHQTLQGVWFQTRSLLAIPIIIGLESSRGRIQIHLKRAVGYWFYPVHIAILTIIAWLVS